ncbi:hypothetical protein V6N11_068130 [Hibiscus sabdariffa]|uniref:Reverse transcriptase domain-containing protein n=1 Tax=Hibiscus sabdariffa TaxID=183260 RepID=A0ABR2SSU5_9ROSI
MSRKKSEKPWMALKVDLEKAYDRIGWSFIEETLHELGIPVQFISWVMYCVSSVSMQIIWNGDLSKGFRPTCGIRQGDPLSPYLFVLCMERLSHAIVKRILIS